MRVCKVFVVYAHSLFAQGIVSLLRQQNGLEIVGTDNDCRRALDHIRASRPDVVILDSNDGGGSIPINLAELLKDSPKVRVINLHFGDNCMDIYDGQQVFAIKQPDDLISAIRAAVKPYSASPDGATG